MHCLYDIILKVMHWNLCDTDVTVEPALQVKTTVEATGSWGLTSTWETGVRVPWET